eukprot:15454117-Alexandrium_andersonii.AAC.1
MSVHSLTEQWVKVGVLPELVGCSCLCSKVLDQVSRAAVIAVAAASAEFALACGAAVVLAAQGVCGGVEAIACDPLLGAPSG